jgi:thiol-disulfide isomerase/thioredoxin
VVRVFLPAGRECRFLAILLLLVLPPQRAAAEQSDIKARRLPDVQVRSLAGSKDVALAESLAGKAAVVLVTDGSAPATCHVGRAAADLQRDHPTRFSWVAVASGPVSADAIDRIRDSSSVRLDRLYLDLPGRLRDALDAPQLPLLLLIDEEGVIRETCSPAGGADRLAAAARTLRSLAQPTRREGSGLEDFRLPLVGSEGLVSFLDVAGEDATLVAFLHSRCLACARELEVLDFARQRHGGRASFVAVFLDPAPETRIRGFLGAAGAVPDFVLRDPELRLATRYGVRSTPSLVVIDAAGEVVLSRAGYREEHRDRLFSDILQAFGEAARASQADSALAEARRLHQEACAFMREGRPGYALLYQERIRELLPEYHSVHLRIAEAALADGRHELALQSLARYLAAKPETYDSAAVRQAIAGLGVPAP